MLLSVLFSSFAVGAIASPLVQIRESNPAITLSLTRRLNISGSSIAEADRARAAHLFQHGQDQEKHGHSSHIHGRATGSSFAVTNKGVEYTTNVGIGSPMTIYTLLIDTGSSNTWIGANKAYVRTRTSVNTGRSVSQSYGVGSFSGTECEL